MTKLYEITALLRVSTVIAADSEEQAMAHVKDWHEAWRDDQNADLVGVSDIKIFDVRDANDVEDEAHDIAAREAENEHD